MSMTWKTTFIVVLGIGLGGCSSDSGSPSGSGCPSGSSSPGVAVELPVPGGPLEVGVVNLPVFHTFAYYPAHAGTGHGPLPYATPELLRTLEVATLPVTAHAALGAHPITDQGPHPVVVVAPGGSSFVELSTSLAEELASHGYVVIMVQPDVETENGNRVGSLPESADPADIALAVETARRQRLHQVTTAIDLLDDPWVAQLVGPVDASRVAVAGHSYGGSTAFNASLVDTRIRAVLDLDGSLFEEAGTIATTVPSLVIMASMYQIVLDPSSGGATPDADLARATVEFLRNSEHVVTVALIDAEHYDVTDAAAIAAALPEALRRDLVGKIGAAGTTNTNAIALRFLDAALALPARVPSAAELVVGLSSATSHVF